MKTAWQSHSERILILDEVVVEGNEETFRGQSCITTRENPWHCWLRAEMHCLEFKDIPWHIAMRAALSCRFAAEAIIRRPRAPKPTSKITWGWGNFPHLKIDNRRKYGHGS